MTHPSASPSAIVLAVAVACLAAASGPALGASGGIEIRQAADDSAITLGETTVDADPDTVFAAVE